MTLRLMECKDTPNCGRVFLAHQQADACPYCRETAGVLEIEGVGHA